METVKVVPPQQQQPTKNNLSVPWVEKHRPRELKDIVGNEDTIEMLQHFALKGNMPNVLLCGTPGEIFLPFYPPMDPPYNTKTLFFR